MAGRKKTYFYDLKIADEICSLLAQGYSIEKLCSLDRFPSRWVIDRWRMEYPEFNQMILDARDFRKEYFKDLLYSKARSGVPVHRRAPQGSELAYMKWMAGFQYPEIFGRNRRHYGWTLDTGVSIICYRPRRKNTVTIEARAKKT